MRRTFSTIANWAMDRVLAFIARYPHITVVIILLAGVALGAAWFQAGVSEVRDNPDVVTYIATAYDQTTHKEVWTHICDDGADLCERAQQGLEDGEGLWVIANEWSREPRSAVDVFFMTWGRFAFAMFIPLFIATAFIGGRWEEYKEQHSIH